MIQIRKQLRSLCVGANFIGHGQDNSPLMIGQEAHRSPHQWINCADIHPPIREWIDIVLDGSIVVQKQRDDMRAGRYRNQPLEDVAATALRDTPLLFCTATRYQTCRTRIGSLRGYRPASCSLICLPDLNAYSLDLLLCRMNGLTSTIQTRVTARIELRNKKANISPPTRFITSKSASKWWITAAIEPKGNSNMAPTILLT